MRAWLTHALGCPVLGQNMCYGPDRGQPTPSSKADMSITSHRQDLAGQALGLSAILASFLLHLVFLGTTVAVNWLADRYIFNALDLTGSSALARDALSWVFTGTTVACATLFSLAESIAFIRSLKRRLVETDRSLTSRPQSTRLGGTRPGALDPRDTSKQ